MRWYKKNLVCGTYRFLFVQCHCKTDLPFDLLLIYLLQLTGWLLCPNTKLFMPKYNSVNVEKGHCRRAITKFLRDWWKLLSIVCNLSPPSLVTQYTFPLGWWQHQQFSAYAAALICNRNRLPTKCDCPGIKQWKRLAR